MPLATQIVDISRDTTQLSDIPLSTTIRRACVCGRYLDEEEGPEEEEEHNDIERDGITICRILYTCEGREFYNYVAVDSQEKPHFINSEIRKNIEIPNCPHCSKKLFSDIISTQRWTLTSDHVCNKTYKEWNKEPTYLMKCANTRINGNFFLRPKEDKLLVIVPDKKEDGQIPSNWEVVSLYSTSEDFTDSLSRSLVVGLEIELDWRKGRETSETTIAKAFGVQRIEDYHNFSPCKICGAPECWRHIPENMIRTVSRDRSVAGYEFIIYGSNISSEDFANKLPLGIMKKYFTPTENDGLHSHALIPHEAKVIPDIVIKNTWQLFRYYYPAWAWIFGNQKVGFFRTNSHYVPFTNYNASPFNEKWTPTILNRETARNGLWIGATRFVSDRLGGQGVEKLDLEFRTPDSSVDIEQLIALRAITRAMILRASQLSTYGLINIDTHGDWKEIRTIIEKLNVYEPMNSVELKKMKENALDFLREISPFLSEFERKCIKNLIENPVRDRIEAKEVKHIIPPLSETAELLKKVIVIARIEAETEDEWFRKVAEITGKSQRELKESLRELKAWFDKESKTMITV